MASELKGLRVAFLTSNEGVEQVELTAPWEAVKDAGGTPELIAPRDGTVQAFNHPDKGDTFTVHRTLQDTDATEYDAIVVPGGVANGDFLRAAPHDRGDVRPLGNRDLAPQVPRSPASPRSIRKTGHGRGDACLIPGAHLPIAQSICSLGANWTRADRRGVASAS